MAQTYLARVVVGGLVGGPCVSPGVTVLGELRSVEVHQAPGTECRVFNVLSLLSESRLCYWSPIHSRVCSRRVICYWLCVVSSPSVRGGSSAGNAFHRYIEELDEI